MERSHSGVVRTLGHRQGGVPPKAEKARGKMYIVYIIQSKSSNKYYIGMTADMDQRLSDHNRGANRSTRGKGPWTLIYRELFQDKKSAWLRERQIKSYKGGNAFKRLINNHGGIA